MKSFADRVVVVLYCLFGAFLGLLIFMFALRGWHFVFTGKATKPWNGLWMMILFCALGAGWGFVSYKFSDREFSAGGSMFFDDPASAALFTKRVMTNGDSARRDLLHLAVGQRALEV